MRVLGRGVAKGGGTFPTKPTTNSTPSRSNENNCSHSVFPDSAQMIQRGAAVHLPLFRTPPVQATAHLNTVLMHQMTRWVRYTSLASSGAPLTLNPRQQQEKGVARAES